MQEISSLAVGLYFHYRGTVKVKAKNNAAPRFSFLLFLLFLFLKTKQKPFCNSNPFQDFLFTAAKRNDSLIYYIYKGLLVKFLCAFSMPLSATYGCINFSVFLCQLLHKKIFHPLWDIFPVMPTFQPKPHCQIGGNDNYLKHPHHDRDF